jgi:hypothetical protein
MTLGFEIVSLPRGTIRQLDQKAFDYGPIVPPTQRDQPYAWDRVSR